MLAGRRPGWSAGSGPRQYVAARVPGPRENATDCHPRAIRFGPVRLLSSANVQPEQSTSREEEEALTAVISREITVLVKTLMGRGPTKTRTYIHRDSVLVLMREAHTPSEGALAGGGRQRAVAQTRVDISEDARRKFIEVIEKHTGKKVLGFMSGSHQDPSLLAHVYVLETSPLVSAVPDP